MHDPSTPWHVYTTATHTRPHFLSHVPMIADNQNHKFPASALCKQSYLMRVYAICTDFLQKLIVAHTTRHKGIIHLHKLLLWRCSLDIPTSPMTWLILQVEVNGNDTTCSSMYNTIGRLNMLHTTTVQPLQ